MLSITLNDKKHKCISSYEEMKVKHYLRIIKEWDQHLDVADRDYFKLLSILTETDYVGFEKTIENDLSIINAVGWVIVQPFEFSKTPPKVLEVRGKVIDIPQDISELSIGQNIHLRRDFIDKSVSLEENIAIATAIYLQPIVEQKRFHMERALALSKEIEEMPINLIYPIGFFLLNRAMTFGMPSMSRWHQIRTNLSKKLKRMWHDSLRFIGLKPSTIFH